MNYDSQFFDGVYRQNLLAQIFLRSTFHKYMQFYTSSMESKLFIENLLYAELSQFFNT